MTGLPAVGLPLELAGVDRRHHGDYGGMRGTLPAELPAGDVGTGTAAKRPRACQVDDQLARRRLALGTAGVDRRHHGDRGTISTRVGTGTAAGRPRRLPGR